jgi:hypothetical protein
MLIWSIFFSIVGSYYILQRLRVFASAPLPPSHVVAVDEDRMAVIKWQESPDTDTVGYKITWSEQGGEQKTLFTPNPDIQIYPLVTGKTYTASVQSVNKNGDLSKSVGPVYAHSDASYVKKLIQEMTGMFDDFNDNPYNGLPNPLHWYTTISNASDISKAYIEGSQNAVSLFVQNAQDVDRGVVTMRSLVPFDFTNRTGTAVFDFDFGQNPVINGVGNGRYQWSFTISPMLTDAISSDVLYNGSPVMYPLEAFEIHMEHDSLSFRKISNGVIVNEWHSTYSHTHPLRDINVLKHAILKLNTESAQLYVDGILVLSASDIHLGFSKGWIYNQQIALNLSKAHIPFALSHFDNIGFDSPAATESSEIHTYTAGGYGISDRKTIDFFHPSISYTIAIPDSTSLETAERLFVDANVDGATVPTVNINGTLVVWSSVIGLSDNNNFISRVFTIPVGTLHQGINTITFSVEEKNTFQITIQNVHAEIEFVTGKAPSYTPYQVPFSGNDITAKIPSVAPIPQFGSHAPEDGATVKGIIVVEAVADGIYSLLPTGHVNPVAQLELDVDGVPQTLLTLDHPTVKTDQLLQFDTTKVANGQHTLTITAYGVDKSSGETIASLTSFAPLLQDSPLDNEQQLRRIIMVNNGISQPTTIPTKVQSLPTEGPTSNPLPTPADTSLTTQQSLVMGNTYIESLQDVNNANHITGSRFITGSNAGEVSQINVYVPSVGIAPNNSYQVAVYSDANGKPGTLIAVSATGVLTARIWNSISITATLQPNTAYWIVYNTNSNDPTVNNLVYGVAGAQTGISLAAPYGIWPHTLTGYSLGNWEYSLFASFAQ